MTGLGGHTLVIPATWEAKIGGLQVQGHSG